MSIEVGKVVSTYDCIDEWKAGARQLGQIIVEYDCGPIKLVTPTSITFHETIEDALIVICANLLEELFSCDEPIRQYDWGTSTDLILSNLKTVLSLDELPVADREDYTKLIETFEDMAQEELENKMY